MKQVKLITLYNYQSYNNQNWWIYSDDFYWNTEDVLKEYLEDKLYHPNIRIVTREFSVRQILTYRWRFAKNVIEMAENL